MEPLKVDPATLHMSADHMDMHRSDHIAAHGAANAQIEEAAPGWLGGSRAALQSKVTDWTDQSNHITDELTHLRDAFDTCGYRYMDTDEEGAANVFRVRVHPGDDNAWMT